MVSLVLLLVCGALLTVPLAVFVEGVTEVVCKSMFFSDFRTWAARPWPSGTSEDKKPRFLGRLLTCGYCFSVWVAMLPALLLAAWSAVQVSWLSAIPVFFGMTVILHRVSNYLHNFNDKHLDKYYSQRRK